MNRSSRFPLSCTICLALALAIGAGCSNDFTPRGVFPKDNLVPTTEIVNPQLSGDRSKYNILLSWKGYDEDGSLSGFEVAVDDTASWFFTTSFESAMVFESKRCCLLDTTIIGGSTEIDSVAFEFHTVFVRALDNLGAADPTPDHISFTSTNIYPETVILRGPSVSSFDITATTVILEWEGRDPDGSVVSYRYRLDDRPWVTVGADCTVVRLPNLASAEFVNDARGFHEFCVISTDNAGAEERTLDPILNCRKWESVKSRTGILRVSSNVIGARTGINSIEGQVFEGTRLSFDWRGDASIYGGLIQCYQYAYDQQETYSACDLNSTHYPPGLPDFEPPIGSHTLFVRAFDDAGQVLNTSFPFVVLRGPDSLNPKILYIDDFDEGSTGSGNLYPNDRPENAFWDTVLTGYPISTFDCEFERDIPTARIIGNATTLIWYLDGAGSRLATSNDPLFFRNPLGPYLNAGGNLILCGQLISGAFAPDNTFDPVEVLQPGCLHRPRRTYSGGDFSLHWFPAFCDPPDSLAFFYDFFKDSVSYDQVGDINNLRDLRSIPSPFGPTVPDLALDFNKRGFLPGGLPILSIGLEDCDQFDLRRIPIEDPDIVIPLWWYVDIQGREKKVCGYYVPRSQRTSRGHILILGFPPYFFDTLEMQGIFRQFLSIFGEKCTGPGCPE